MASLNKTALIGYLGADPVIRYMPDGKPTAHIQIATTDVWKDKTTGEKKEKTEWHRVVFFAKLAEIAQEYLKKGAQVYVEGKLRTHKWGDDAGIDRYTTAVHVYELKMLGKKSANEEPDAPTEALPLDGDLLDDVIPF